MTLLETQNIALRMFVLQKVNFQENINMIVHKVYGILGYLKCWFNELVDPC